MTVYQTPAFDRDATRVEPPAILRRARISITASMPATPATFSIRRRTRATSARRSRRSGLRLNAAWIFHWLKNAQALRPGTQELNWNMNDEDARAITAFLMQQKTAPKEGGCAMKRTFAVLGMLAVAGCHRAPPPGPAATAFGVAIVESAAKNRSPARAPRWISRWWRRSTTRRAGPSPARWCSSARADGVAASILLPGSPEATASSPPKSAWAAWPAATR